MPKRSNKGVASSVAVSTVKHEEDGEKGFGLPVQLTKKQCVDSFVESVDDSADKNGIFWYKHVTCAICMDPIDKPSSGVVLDCKHHPFHASCIVKSLQRDRRCPRVPLGLKSLKRGGRSAEIPKTCICKF